jgi:hypothetical protein
MTATIATMDYIYADILSPDQLMEDDLIEITSEDEEQMITVKEIVGLKEGYIIVGVNEFGETNEYFLNDNQKVKLFVLM